jgi:hypothetical protein
MLHRRTHPFPDATRVSEGPFIFTVNPLKRRGNGLAGAADRPFAGRGAEWFLAPPFTDEHSLSAEGGGCERVPWVTLRFGPAIRTRRPTARPHGRTRSIQDARAFCWASGGE